MGRRKLWKMRAFMALGAVLTALTLIFPQVGFLEWFTLIPLAVAAIRLCEDKAFSLRAAWVSGFLTAFCFYFVLFHWLVDLYPMDFIGMDNAASVVVIAAGWIGVPALDAVVGGTLFLLFCLLQKSGLFNRAPLLRPFVFAALWVVFEWCITQTWAGVPWGRLALGQIEMRPLLWLSSVAGSYAVTFLLVAVNCLFAEIVISNKRTVVCGVLAAALFIGNLGGGLIWFHRPEAQGTVRAAVLQGNIGSHEKWDGASADRTIQTYEELTRAAAADGAELIVWPETALPYVLNYTPSLREWLSDLAAECHATLVVGALYDDADGNEYNSLYLIGPDGSFSGARYDKRHLVPFGEYVPMRQVIVTLIPPLGKVSALDDDLSAGRSAALLPTGWGEIGGLVCFDSIYETLAVDSVRAGADILVISSNDSWFYDSAAVRQHKAQAQLRAVETGRWILRAANTGISAVITPRGETKGEIPALTAGYTVENVSFSTARTVYSRVGNLFVWLCMAFFAGSLAAGYLPKRKKEN